MRTTKTDKNKQYYLQHMKKHIKSTQMGLTCKSEVNKVFFAAVFLDIIGRGALPKETFIQTVKMTAIKTCLKEIYNRNNIGY